MKQEKWKITEGFEGFMIPQELKSLLHWIVTAPKITLDISYKRKKEIEKFVDIAGQIIMKSVKTRRQVNYVANKNFRQKKKHLLL